MKGGILRIFRLMILLPALLCAGGAIAAPACYQLYGKCNGACLTSGTSNSKNDNFFYKCGGGDGCPKGAAVSISASNSGSKYHLCDGTKWKTIQEDYLDKNALDVRNCIGDGEYAPNRIYTGQEYDFFTEYKTGSILLSDICKKPKTDAGTVNKPEPVKTVEKPKSNATPDQPKQTEQKPGETATTETPESKTETPVTVASTPGSTEQPKPNTEKATPVTTTKPAGKNFTITGTVVDDTGVGLPFATIVVVDSNIHTITDINGNFTIQPTSPDDELEFKFVGFEPLIISANEAQKKSKIVLTGINTLKEVEVTVCEKTDEEIDPETGKCVKIKTAEPAKEPAVEPAVATEPPVPAPKPTPEELEKRLTESQDALYAARNKENSLANKLLTGASTAATGIGGMQAASAFAEQRADAAAEKQMREYLATFKCDYGGGQEFNAGNEEITLPGGNELLEYYTEYKTLADNLKTTKAALGLRNGIESETLYDRAESGLYQYATAERKSGGEISLARALSDETSEDAARWAEQKEQTAKQLKTGIGVTAGGAAVGLGGNAAINTDMIQNIKDAFKK